MIARLPVGKKRELSSIFEAIAGAYVKDLVIRDPYCGARPHRNKLKAFLIAIKVLASSISHIAVQCKEYRDKDGDVEFSQGKCAGIDVGTAKAAQKGLCRNSGDGSKRIAALTGDQAARL